MNEARKQKILENVKKFKIKNFILLAQIRPEYLTLSIFLLLLNIPLLPMVRHLKPLTLLLKVLTVQNAL